MNGWIDFFNSFQPCHFDRSGEKKDFTLWQSDNHPIEVYSLRVIEQKLAYIHLNPVREDIVAQPEHYLHSSASNYVDGTGLLNVIVIDPMSDVGYLHL